MGHIPLKMHPSSSASAARAQQHKTREFNVSTYDMKRRARFMAARHHYHHTTIITSVIPSQIVHYITAAISSDDAFRYGSRLLASCNTYATIYTHTHTHTHTHTNKKCRLRVFLSTSWQSSQLFLRHFHLHVHFVSHYRAGMRWVFLDNRRCKTTKQRTLNESLRSFEWQRRRQCAPTNTTKKKDTMSQIVVDQR